MKNIQKIQNRRILNLHLKSAKSQTSIMGSTFVEQIPR